MMPQAMNSVVFEKQRSVVLIPSPVSLPKHLVERQRLLAMPM